MSPLVAAFTIGLLSSPAVKRAIQSLADEALNAAKGALIRRLTPSVREEAAKRAIWLFAEEWNKELEDTCVFEAALRGYRSQLKTLVESAAAEIVEWMDPATRIVDLSLIASTWTELKLDELPQGFDWKSIARNYAQAIRLYIKNNRELREAYSTALLEKTSEASERSALALERLAPPSPGLDLETYRKYLINQKCNDLQLAAMNPSAHGFNQRVKLSRVFIPQWARESAPPNDLPSDVQMEMLQEGEITELVDARRFRAQSVQYSQRDVRPVLEIFDDAYNRLVVVIGDPGSGKTSLIRHLALRWAEEDLGPIPILVDLRAYVKERKGGIVEYCHSGHDVFHLDRIALGVLLQAGRAAFYLDGLDEIFDAPTRLSVIEEIVVLSAEYSSSRVVVTSRKVGYEPERLRNAGFTHATLERLERPQITEFIGLWYKAVETSKTQRSLLANRLEKALHDFPPIRELAGNPMLLTMMAILNIRKELPRSRVELYREVGRLLLCDWDVSKALRRSKFDHEEKAMLLRQVAGQMQRHNNGLAINLIERSRLGKTIQKFLQQQAIPESHFKAKLLVCQLTERNFILVYAGSNRFSFVHRTFLEYYCACWFVDRLKKKRDLTFARLTSDVFGGHWKEAAWHEVLRLITGMIGTKHAEQAILFLMGLDGRGAKLANLMLAAGCLGEVQNRAAIQATGEALWQRFLNEVIRFNGVSENAEPIGHPEVVRMRLTAVRWMALSWKEEHARVWLRDAATNDQDWIVRQAAIYELARSWHDDPETLPLLRDCARDEIHEDVLRTAIEVLARAWQGDQGTLEVLKIRALSEKNYFIQREIAHDIARLWEKNPETEPWLRERVRNAEKYGVWQAALTELDPNLQRDFVGERIRPEYEDHGNKYDEIGSEYADFGREHSGLKTEYNRLFD